MTGKKQNTKKHKQGSELRRDIVTGEWVVIAHSRGNRPDDFAKKEEAGNTKTECPFEVLGTTSETNPVLTYKNKNYSDWSLQVVENKFPAFFPGGDCDTVKENGPYYTKEGVGHHEVIITRDHEKHLALQEKEEVADVVRAYKDRYNELKNERCIRYVSIFHNHGKEAGASIEHPHSQLIAIPVLPPGVRRSLRGSNLHYRRNGDCVHCAMINWEQKDDKRIIFENSDFLVFCPFVSRAAFEVRIFPKKHEAYFEDIKEDSVMHLAEALQVSLKSLYTKLDNPDYNFFVHTSPADSKEYPNYHWHMEILPKTAIRAGFEFSTGIEISTIEPEKAAEHLRSALVNK